MAAITELPVESLPSKGYGYKFNMVRLPKLVFSQITEYSSEIYKCNNELSSFLCQLKHLLLNLPNGSEISMYDAIPLMAIRCYTSTSDKLTDFIKIKYHCPLHDRQEVMKVDMTKMKFNDIDPMLKKLKAVKLDGKYYDLRVPTVGEFVATANKIKMKLPKSHALKYLWMMSAFTGIEKDDKENENLADRVLNAISKGDSKDIIALNKIYSLLTGAFTYFVAHCSEEGGEPVVRIPTIEPITDIFQNILLNEEFDQDTFDFREDE